MSMGKGRKKVCTDEQGTTTTPSPWARLFRPSRPRSRDQNRSAHRARSARSAPRVSLWMRTSAIAAPSLVNQEVVDVDDCGCEDDDQKGGQDPQHQREEQLDRCPLVPRLRRVS